ncbi:MAG: poly-beta-1,6-N-acetyl-D-glucosamine biosynthesis protein PgaD [Desulfatiglans sp.]|nr:poly-beta-1,6-N-acetyl-D-glucosamine biosynthesis protein PgaD [Desulfatiglans sp.]
MKSLIIERPEKQSAAQRFGFGLLTIAFWGLFAYFIRPVLTLGAWVVGLWRFQDVMIEAHGIEHLGRLLLLYGVIILCMALVLIAWSFYNLFRYGHNEKRINQPQPVTVEMLGDFFKVAPEKIKAWQEMKNITLGFNPDGSLLAEEHNTTKKPV